MASTLAAELVEEILIRVPPDEPAHLIHAAVVCKAWRRILSDDTFLHRYRRFHRTPPLVGYICRFNESTVQFVPTATSVAGSSSPVGQPPPALSCIDRALSALDCRHGRVLIKASSTSDIVDRLIVWDPITGDQHHLILPTHLHTMYNHAGAVLCAKDKDGCDHLDCRHAGGGAFLVVLLGMSMSHESNGVGGVHLHTWASVYSSETGAWSARTPSDTTKITQYIDDTRLSILTRDALYFPTVCMAYNIIRYDLRKHELSVIIGAPGEGRPAILIKGDDGGLGAAVVSRKCIEVWSWKVGTEGVGEWVKYKVVDLHDTVLPIGGRRPPHLICVAEGTSTVFIGIQHAGIFTLDLKSKQVRRLGEGRKTIYGLILPYVHELPHSKYY